MASEYITKRDEAILKLESERVDNLSRFEQLQTILLKQAEVSRKRGCAQRLVTLRVPRNKHNHTPIYLYRRRDFRTSVIWIL